MTQPVIHGYPDFGRYQAQSDKFLYQNLFGDLDVIFPIGVFFVGDVRGIGLYINAIVNHVRVIVNFTEDSGGSNLFSAHTIDVRQGTIFEGSLPVLGPWASVSITPSAVNSQAQVIIWTTANFSQQLSASPTSSILFTQAGNLPAGLSTFVLPNVRMGRAMLDYLFPANLSNIVIESVDYLGTARRICAVQSNGGQEAREVILPPTTISLSITNFAAGAAFYSVILSFDPTTGW